MKFYTSVFLVLFSLFGFIQLGICDDDGLDPTDDGYSSYRSVRQSPARAPVARQSPVAISRHTGMIMTPDELRDLGAVSEFDFPPDEEPIVWMSQAEFQAHAAKGYPSLMPEPTEPRTIAVDVDTNRVLTYEEAQDLMSVSEFDLPPEDRLNIKWITRSEWERDYRCSSSLF